jgi:hypothetical protein
MSEVDESEKIAELLGEKEKIDLPPMFKCGVHGEQGTLNFSVRIMSPSGGLKQEKFFCVFCFSEFLERNIGTLEQVTL